MKIHKEGLHTILLVTIVVSAAIVLSGMFLRPVSVIHYIISGIGILFIAMVALFFRVPRRIIPTDERAILSGADGKIVAIEEVFEDEYLKDRCILVSVFMSVSDVHVNYAPLSGDVSYFKYHPGKYMLAWLPKSSTENERTTLVIENPHHGSVLVRQIAGALARRIVCHSRPDQRLKQGDEFGIIKFGSRVDHYLPLDAKVQVAMNQVVRGGQSVIARME